MIKSLGILLLNRLLATLFLFIFPLSISSKTINLSRHLLTNDFDILNDEDLLDYATRSSDLDRITENSLGIFYWQCVESKIIHFNCRSFEEPDTDGIVYSELEISIKHLNGTDTEMFSGRRALPIEVCEELIEQCQILAKDQTYICIAGSPVKYYPDEQEYLWMFDRFKTKLGCASYFLDDC